MKPSIRLALGLALLFAGTSVAADPPGKLAMLPDYTHEPLKGIDSVVGKISKPKGLTIQYEIGRVAAPGQLRVGGDFTDHAKSMKPADRQWYKEQKIGGKQVHLALSKADVLFVVYPDSGINFYVTVKNAEEMAEALLMLLTYQGK